MSTMRWTNDALLEALKRYGQECEAAGLQPITVDSYVHYAHMFLRWRIGDYRPRTAIGPPRPPSRTAATREDLAADHRAYEADLRAAKLQPQAVQTYLVHSAMFIRWLDGEFVPGSRLPASGRVPVRRIPVTDSRPTTASSPETWTWEGSVQAAMVVWLEAAGWSIERAADTKAREHGPDIVATSGPRRLAVEVKGYPQATYASGAKAGEPKKWHPAAQARTYFGNAVHTALVMRDGMPGAEIAIALPDVPGYRSLLDQVHVSLATLAVRVFLVGSGGSVRELVPASA